MDEQEDISFETLIAFTCPVCKDLIRDYVPAPAQDSFLGVAPVITQGEADVLCLSCKGTFGLNVKNLGGHIHVQVAGYPLIQVEASKAILTEELEAFGDIWDIPETPSNVLCDTLKDVDEVTRLSDAVFYVKTLSRMALIQQFAALEAYLSDTLIKRVLDHPEVLERALAGIEELREIKLPLTAIAANPDIVKTTAANYLRDLMYHNFGKVDAIWKKVLGNGIFPSVEVKERMFKAGPIRHDCVHRNGKDKDGKERTEVNYAFVAQLADDIMEMVNHIEDALLSIDYKDAL